MKIEKCLTIGYDSYDQHNEDDAKEMIKDWTNSLEEKYNVEIIKTNIYIGEEEIDNEDDEELLFNQVEITVEYLFTLDNNVNIETFENELDNISEEFEQEIDATSNSYYGW